MFLVDLGVKEVTRNRLNKQGWIPSDLTRIHLRTSSFPTSALWRAWSWATAGSYRIHLQQGPDQCPYLGTASGAFKMAIDHAKKRKIFNQRIVDHQAKPLRSRTFTRRSKQLASRFSRPAGIWIQARIFAWSRLFQNISPYRWRGK